MSEYQGNLRVATTVDAAFFGEFDRTQPHNNVYVMMQQDTRLDIVGSLEKLAIGEEVKSARFIGDRGYLVTFERRDPLHTLDLSDPRNPLEVGTLIVPGFSTYIVPMDADHLLTVGQYIPEDDPFGSRGVQLSIFDISDFAHPAIDHNIIIRGDGGIYSEAYSEALGNSKAFTYFASAGLIALPISIYNYGPFMDDFVIEPGDTDGDQIDDGGMPADNTTSQTVDEDIAIDPIEPGAPPDTPASEPPQKENFDGLFVFSVSAETGFTELGRISTTFDQAYWWTAFTRGVFIGDDVFAVTNQGVRGAPIDDIESVPYELLLGSDDEIADDVNVVEDDRGSSTPGADGAVSVDAEELP
jgi:hypothetical protein